MLACSHGVRLLFRHTLQRLLRSREPRWVVEQAKALRVLERDRVLTAAEAHALRAGEQLADLYADVNGDEVGVDAERLDEIAHQVRIGNLPEALIQIGRLHPALADLPDLYQRSARHGRA